MARSRFRQELRSSVRPLSSAELRARGVTRRQSHGSRWRQTSRGFFVPRSTGLVSETPTQRILDIVPLIPSDGAVTGWAAGFVHGVDLLDGLDSRTMKPVPVQICCPRSPSRAAAPHLTHLRSQLAPDEISLAQGVRVASPMRATFDGARLAANLEEAVAFVDAVAHAGLVDPQALARYAADHPGWKGVRLAARAVDLADTAARSPAESRLRICYLTEAGLPRPEVNRAIFDLEERLLGIADLLDEEAALVTEFDGGLHRATRRHHDDNVREERLESAGLVVVRADTIDLTSDRTALVLRMRDGYRRGLQRDRSRDRWTLVEPEWWLAQQDPLQLLTERDRAELLDY